MAAIHSDFSITSNGIGSDFVLGILDTVAYGDDVRREEEALNADTASLLDSICASVSEIVPDFEGDMGDFAADLDEIVDSW